MAAIYEYKTRILSADFYMKENSVDLMNDSAKDGWRLHSCVVVKETLLLVFEHIKTI